ncbi:MAG TPA: PLD nuclease N-terminal domain-containing protein [Galbitalea sp.]|nr:PLD nuclease N-terminal domain-containing protein [Galbitalea sp.]
MTLSIDGSLTDGSLATISPWLLVALGVIALAELVLDVIALVDLYRRPITQVTLGNKWVWVVLIILINLIGSILYLAIGRKGPERSEHPQRPTEQRGNAASVVDVLYGARDDTKPQ